MNKPALIPPCLHSTASLFAIQSNIARAITAALNTTLSNADENLLDSIPTDSLAAYDAYLMGRQNLLGNSVEAYKAAMAYFEDAISLDSSFAGAYAGLCRAQLGLYWKSSDVEQFSAAESACERALGIDAERTEVHIALGSLYRYYGDQPDHNELAAKHAMRVVELNPKSAAAWNNLGTAYHSLQQYDAAKIAWDSVLQLEPTRAAYTNRGLQYYYEGWYADSAEMQLKAIELAPKDHRVWGRLAESYLAMGDKETEKDEAYATAIRLAEPMLEINAQDWLTRSMLALYYVQSGRAEDARGQIEIALSLSKRDPEALLYAALVFKALGEQENALPTLEEMVKADSSYRNFAAREPAFKSLYGNPRYDRLITPDL